MSQSPKTWQLPQATSPLPEPRHQDELGDPPASQGGEREGRLAHLLVASAGDLQVPLIDDVHQVLRFADAPEDLPHSCP